MKIKTLITLMLLATFHLIYGQDMGKYSKLAAEADSLFKIKEYKTATKKYKAAFKTLDGKAFPNHRFNIACCYALTNDIKNSFYHLFYLAENTKIKYSNLNRLMITPAFETLYSKKRWDKLVSIVKANKDEEEKDLNKPLVAQLDSIRQLDQKYRQQLKQIEEKYGRGSDEMKAHWKLIQRTDSTNEIKVTKILDQYGWLGPKVIGNQGNGTLFLVIQHAPLQTQVKYLPMMRNAVKEGNAWASNLALLEDRVALRQGKRQIYGSQIGRDLETGEYYVSPLLEPEKVNERRKTMGLGRIEDYISHWNLTWDVEKHKQRTQLIENKKKK